jgi:hypothetical protein
MTRRSPQEKKALSYARDRRNDYGENDKSSRKNVRRNKRTPVRADRRREHQMLAFAAGVAADMDLAESAEITLLCKKSMWFTKPWRKRPDAPLVVIVERRLRARLGMIDPVLAERLIDRVRAHRQQFG